MTMLIKIQYSVRGCHAMAPPDFGRSVKPISTPGFQIFRRPWIFKGKRIKIFFEICFVKILMLTATYRFDTIF